jgi:hypothetical protein
MENRKIIEFENKIGIDPIEAVLMIKIFVSNEIKKMTFLEEYNNRTGHWGIKYAFKDLIFTIQSDFGDLNVLILHNSKEVALKEIDEFMTNVIVASRKNIEYMLFSLKRLINTFVLLEINVANK